MNSIIQLPAPVTTAPAPLNEILNSRHSVRSFTDEPLSQTDLATVLWATYGVQGNGTRTAPSALKIYGMKVIVAATNVSGIAAGFYVWDHASNSLTLVSEEEPKAALFQATNQQTMADAAAVLVITGNSDLYTERFPERAEAFVLLEAGMLAENALLMATALDLAAVPAGGFAPKDVTRTASLPQEDVPCLLVPLGHHAS